MSLRLRSFTPKKEKQQTSDSRKRSQTNSKKNFSLAAGTEDRSFIGNPSTKNKKEKVSLRRLRWFTRSWTLRERTTRCSTWAKATARRRPSQGRHWWRARNSSRRFWSTIAMKWSRWWVSYHLCRVSALRQPPQIRTERLIFISFIIAIR